MLILDILRFKLHSLGVPPFTMWRIYYIFVTWCWFVYCFIALF